MRRRSAELFPTDRPLAADRMIGRQDDLAQMVRQIGSGINLVVAGPRRTGKTTLCQAAVAVLRDQGAYTVSVDLFGMDGAADLAESIIDGAISNRSALHRVAKRARQAGRSALTATQMTLATRAMAELGGDLEVTFGVGGTRRRPHHYLAYALHLCQRLAEMDDRLVVLFIDEFQKLASPSAPFGDPDSVTQSMRSAIMASNRITCLFASSVEYILRDLFSDERRAFYRFGQFTTLSPIAPKAWRTGLLARADEDGCAFSADALDLLLEMSGGHPRATMLVAQQAHDAAVANDTTVIDSTLVRVGWQAAMAAEVASNATAVDHIGSLAAHALSAAKAVAAGTSPYERLRPAQARRAMDSLVRAGLIAEEGRGRWSIPDPFLNAYLRSLDGHWST